ncbi:Tyrosine kinase, EPH (ephrin) receptor family [Ectocarpus siliculosus]|uniref:Tyrosine kinase, EPH (Ephrin) receptor family n=1 Tax=Ectocarpus siliculosus TaxID=2880 RepID=D7FZX4_ECTSI|nr:Tyrosine kinase, EPH (ephrin) receptor family [Ectocarpus siliculosus]|eukprot:CBJ48599.1 Tyrosine kinase, EPH (ephrin) receptor family [Ectocarpus siliculosus]
MMKWPCCAPAAAAGPSTMSDTAAGRHRPRHGCLKSENTCRRRRQPGGGRGCDPEGGDASAGAPAMGWWQEGRRHHGMAKVAVALGVVLAAGCCAPAARAASAGASHSCTVLVGGTIKCWGENFWGQLGQNDNLVRGKNASDMGDNLPYVQLGIFEADMVASGSEFNCARSVDREVKCWGRNSAGQLGLGDNETRGGVNNVFEMGNELPVVDLGAGVMVETIGLAGSHACAVTLSGLVKCWGENEGGQLGLEDKLARGNLTGQMGDNLPYVDLGTGVLASSVALGARHTCAVVDDGGVKCWGNNDGGQLGYGDTSARGTAAGEMGDDLPFVDLGRDQKVVAVAAGFFHTCALLYTGDVKCWGFGSNGQLGQGTNESIGNSAGTMGDNLPPIDLGTGSTAIAMSLGGTHSCAVLDDHTVKCWGGNSVGSLGLGDILNRGTAPGEMGDNLPDVDLDFGTGAGSVSNVFAGRFHTCVSGTEGGLVCFGLNTGGQLGAGTDESSIGDEPGEVAALSSISLGTDEVAAVVAAPGEGLALQTISPTPAPTAERLTTPPVIMTRSPVEQTDAPYGAGHDSGPADLEGNGDSGDGGDAGTTAAIATAAILIPGFALFGLFCCYRRRKRKEGELKRPSAAVSAGPGGGSGREFGREDSFTSSENNVEANGEGPTETLANKPLVKPHALQSTAPMTDGRQAGGEAAATAGTLGDSTEGLLRPPTAATAMAVGAAIAAGTAAAAGTAGGDDDESSRSDLENPGRLRRTGSNSSISTLGSTSTASSTWPNDGFVTPARNNIPRGAGGGRYGLGGIGGKGGEGLPPGYKTPGNLSAATPNREMTIPETPSPRSVSSSVHGTPAPPGMRLAQFARVGGGGGDTSLYGLPEMEIGRSTSNVYDSSPSGSSWPVGSKGGAPLTAASIAAAAAAATASAQPTPGDSANPSPNNNATATSPTAEIDTGGRKSNRSSRTAGASPTTGGVGGAWGDREGGGGMGAEAAAQAFTEEAELEALQIDKNDLKLVFGRPFARGKSSEVYQVTHAGKNRAAKIIDLFSLGVVGEEVTRLYASFAQELRAMKGIRHDCVAAVYGAVATPSELTIVTDLVKRGPLRTLLTDKKKRESLTPAIRHKIIKDVASGMGYLYEQGLQHRNLHSHNVLITKEWGAKVADYGLARTSEVMLGAHDRAKTKSKSRSRPPAPKVGALRWMAPELLQASTDGSVDLFTEASDVYSVGVIAWEVLCGGSKLPYDGIADDKVKSMIIEGSTPPVSMETPIVYNKLMLLCWRKNPLSRPSFSHMASVLLRDPPPVGKASPRLPASSSS